MVNLSGLRVDRKVGAAAPTGPGPKVRVGSVGMAIRSAVRLCQAASVVSGSSSTEAATARPSPMVR
jgi:hypothetical protein